MYRKIFTRLITAFETLQNKTQHSNTSNELFAYTYEVEMSVLQSYIIAKAMLGLTSSNNSFVQKCKKKGRAMLIKMTMGMLSKFGKVKTATRILNLLESLKQMKFIQGIEKKGSDLRASSAIKFKHTISKTELENIKEDLECPLCMNMFYKPTALPCGHVLCLPCLARTLDHAFQKQVNCPLCRSSLNQYLYFLNSEAQMLQNCSGAVPTGGENGEKTLVHGSAMIPVEKTLHQLLLRNFPEEYKKRSLMARTEEAPSRPATDPMSSNATASCDKSNTNVTAGNVDEIPIFVCGMAFPGIAFPLHVL